MASEKIDETTARHRMLESLSASDLEDSLERNIHHTLAMWVQIAHEMIQEDPTQQAMLLDQVANLEDLQAEDQQLAKIIEEEMTHCKQVPVLLHMHLKLAEEVKALSQEIRHLLALVEEQQEATGQLTKLASPQSPPRTPKSLNIALKSPG